MSKFYIGNELIIDPDVKLEKVELTQAEYDALENKKDNILYIITDAEDPFEVLESEIEDKYIKKESAHVNGPDYFESQTPIYINDFKDGKLSIKTEINTTPTTTPIHFTDGIEGSGILFNITDKSENYSETDQNLVTTTYAFSKFAKKENALLESSSSNLLHVIDDNDLIYVPKGITDISRNIANGRTEPITVKQAYDAGRTPATGPVVVTFNKPTFNIAESAILEAANLSASDGNNLRLYVESIIESGDSLQLKVSAINNADNTGAHYVPNVPANTVFYVRNGGLYLNIKAGKGLEKYKENGYPYFKIDDTVLTDENLAVRGLSVQGILKLPDGTLYADPIEIYNSTEPNMSVPLTWASAGTSSWDKTNLRFNYTNKTKTYTTNHKNIVTADYLHTKFLENSTVLPETEDSSDTIFIPVSKKEDKIGIKAIYNNGVDPVNTFPIKLHTDGNRLILGVSYTHEEGVYDGNKLNIVTVGHLNKRLAKLDNSPFLVVTELPSTNINPNKIYLVSSDVTQVASESETEIPKQNIYTEWLYVNGAWEKLGEVTVDIDLTNYYTKTESNNRYFKISDLKTDLSINRDNYIPLLDIKQWNASNPQAGIAFDSGELVTTIGNNPVRLSRNGNVLKVVSYITKNDNIDYSESINLTTAKYVHDKFLTKDVVPTEDALPEKSKVVLEKYPIYDDSNNIIDYTYSLVVPSTAPGYDILSELHDNPVDVNYTFDNDNYYIGEQFTFYITDGTKNYSNSKNLVTAKYAYDNFISKSQVPTGYNATIPVFLTDSGSLKVPAINLLKQNIAANTANETIIVNLGTNYGHALAYRVTDESSEVDYSITYNLVTSKYLYSKFYTKEQCDNNYLTADDLPTNILTDNNLNADFDANTNFRPIEKWNNQNPILGVVFPNPVIDYTKHDNEYKLDKHGGINTLYCTSKDEDYSPYFISSGAGYVYYKNLVTADYLHTKFVTKTDFSSALTTDNVNTYSGVQNEQILVKIDNNGTLFTDRPVFIEKTEANSGQDNVIYNPYSHNNQVYITGTDSSIDYSTSKNLVTSQYAHSKFSLKSEEITGVASQPAASQVLGEIVRDENLLHLYATVDDNIDYSTAKNLVTSDYLHTNFSKKEEVSQQLTNINKFSIHGICLNITDDGETINDPQQIIDMTQEEYDSISQILLKVTGISTYNETDIVNIPCYIKKYVPGTLPKTSYEGEITLQLELSDVVKKYGIVSMYNKNSGKAIFAIGRNE